MKTNGMQKRGENISVFNLLQSQIPPLFRLYSYVYYDDGDDGDDDGGGACHLYCFYGDVGDDAYAHLPRPALHHLLVNQNCLFDLSIFLFRHQVHMLCFLLFFNIIF